VNDESEFTLDDLREAAEWSTLDDDTGSDLHVEALRAQMTDVDVFEEAEEILREIVSRPCRTASFRCFRNDAETWP